MLLLLLAAWAAVIGPAGVFRADPVAPPPAAVEGEPDAPPDSRPGEPDEEEVERGWGSTAALLTQLLLLCVVGYLLVLLVRLFRSESGVLEQLRRRRRPVEFEVLPPAPDDVAEEMVRDAADQLALLREGTARNGIVACWHRFEVQASSVGLAREPWETSAEFTLRILDLVSADDSAVLRLGVLYREARFSDHDLGEAARADAVDALERIHRGLRQRLAGARG